MNIEQAKAIAIAEILSRLDIHPRKSGPDKLLYLSPVRQEKTPSFYVYQKTNTWHDYGDGRGGDTVAFAQAFLRFTREADTVSDALRWIGNIGLGPYTFTPVDREPAPDPEPGLILHQAGPIQHPGLLHYVEKRGIPLAVAASCLRQMHVRNPRTGKRFFALGLRNEEGGHDLRNPFFKGTLGRKAISFIRGGAARPTGLHLFEGVFDYLSLASLATVGRLQGDTIILNSVANLKQIAPYVTGYGYRVAYSWLDNDPAGVSTTATLDAFLKTQEHLTHKPMNRVYTPHQDVNAWHMHRLGLAPLEARP